MDRFKNRFRVANTVALFIIAAALVTDRGLAAPGAAPALAPLGSAFTYEGRIPATLSGRYDFRFRLFNAASGGALVDASVASAANVLVQNGEYIAPVNFGAAAQLAFTGDARYLEVRYRPQTTDPAAPYTLLAGPRPQLLPVPYAMSLRPGATVQGALAEYSAAITGSTFSPNAYGLMGFSQQSAGVFGQSADRWGVYGRSASGPGVYGETYAEETTTDPGVYGKAILKGGVGVIGEARLGIGWGVYGIANGGMGVRGAASTGIGVAGYSASGSAGV